MIARTLAAGLGRSARLRLGECARTVPMKPWAPALRQLFPAEAV